jgi:hypothetical protein
MPLPVTAITSHASLLTSVTWSACLRELLIEFAVADRCDQGVDHGRWRADACGLIDYNGDIYVQGPAENR